MGDARIIVQACRMSPTTNRGDFNAGLANRRTKTTGSYLPRRSGLQTSFFSFDVRPHLVQTCVGSQTNFLYVLKSDFNNFLSSQSVLAIGRLIRNTGKTMLSVTSVPRLAANT